MEQAGVVFSGWDGSGRVRVDIDGAGRVVAVDVVDGPARADGPALGDAVVAAYHAAGIARLSGWTPDIAPAAAPPTPPDDRPVRERVEHILRVGADLREYALQLAEGRDRRYVGRSSGGEVSAVVLGARLVSVAVDPRVVGSPPELGGWIRTALRDALRRPAELGVAALDGCPDLAELLGRAR